MRLLTLFFSITTLACLGRALAGLGGFLFGRGRIDYIAQGLVLGCLSTLGAFWAWKRYLKELEAESATAVQKDVEDPPS